MEIRSVSVTSIRNDINSFHGKRGQSQAENSIESKNKTDGTGTSGNDQINQYIGINNELSQAEKKVLIH